MLLRRVQSLLRPAFSSSLSPPSSSFSSSSSSSPALSAHYLSMLKKQQQPADINATIDSTILFEDDAIVVVNKPPSVLSQPVEDGSANIFDALRRTRPSLFQIKRLDRNCSGVMLFAKTEAAAGFLSKYLRNDIQNNGNESLNDNNLSNNYSSSSGRAGGRGASRPSLSEFSREYVCVVNGDLQGHGRLLNYLKIKKGKMSNSNANSNSNSYADASGNGGLKATVMDGNENRVFDPEVRRSELVYKSIVSFKKPNNKKIENEEQQISSTKNSKSKSKLVDNSNNKNNSNNNSNSDNNSNSNDSDAPVQTLVAIYPIVGTKHHVRAQLAHAGFPIVGDLLYGAPQGLKHKEIAMHSRSVTFVHPISGKKMTFVAEAPMSWTLRFGVDTVDALKKFKW